MNVFPFIEAERAERRNVAKACELLEVSRSAFYEHTRHLPSARALADAELAERIEAIHEASRSTYGWPRVHQALRREGIHVSRKRVARIMRQRGLIGRCRRRFTVTTISDPDTKAVDLLKRAFGPGTVALDQAYVGDITYIWTWEGWLYLATVIDLSSRRVVGWAMADHMRTELVADALRMAIGARRPAPGLIFHSDRGGQYTSKEFTDLLAEHQITQSLSRPRQCLGQRRGRELLRFAEDRADRPPVVGHPDPGPPGDLRLHRDLLQPPTPPLLPGLPHAGGVRSHHPPRRGRCGGIIRLSGEPGQPQSAPRGGSAGGVAATLLVSERRSSPVSRQRPSAGTRRL